MKKIVMIFLLAVILSLTGCQNKTEITKIKDLEFTLCKEENYPKELAQLIQEKKEAPFKMTYITTQYLYIIVGYGEQSMGGYSINVTDLYLAENGIYIDTNLVGPSQDEKTEPGATYPYVVVKTERYEKPVVFR